MNSHTPVPGQRAIRTALAATLLLVLAACAHTPRQPDDAARLHDDMLMQLGDADAGSVVELPAGNPLALGSVTPGPFYTAASLRQCRRLLNANGVAIGRVLCRTGEGDFYLQRSLLTGQTGAVVPTPQRVTSEPVASVVPAVPDDDIVSLDGLDAPAADATVERHTLRDGETLWSFSRRVTGNANNWQRIADANGIADTTAIAAGTELAVPAALVQAGD